MYVEDRARVFKRGRWSGPGRAGPVMGVKRGWPRPAKPVGRAGEFKWGRPAWLGGRYYVI